MKSEDTVIKGGVKQTLKINWSNTITGHLLGWQPTIEPDAQDKIDDFIRQIRMEQAEISFKAGIREVVEWMEKHEVKSYAASPSGVHLVDIGMLDGWQAKLKEWGVEE